MHNLKWILQPLSAFAAGMLVVINLTLYFFWYLPGYNNINSAVDQLGNSLARNLAFQATAPLYASDRAALSNLLNRFAEEQNVISASVNAEEASGLQLQSRTKTIDASHPRAFLFPIHFSDTLLGSAQIDLSEYDLLQWQSQAITSWFLFNLLSLAGLGAFIYFRTQKHEKQWQAITEQLEVQLPEIYQQLSGTPEKQLEQLIGLLNNPMSHHGRILRHLRSDSLTDDPDRLVEQLELVSNEGEYRDVALVAIQCQNWEDLIRTYSATDLQQVWSDYESLMIRVGELYSGILLPDGFSLAFGLQNDEDFAFDALCAARVLQVALQKMAEQSSTLSPVFGIAISAGPAFISKTHKHGLPLPLVTGDAEIWLSQIIALQPVNQILIAEPLLQFESVNQQVDVTLLRDVTLRDGHRLEVWELDSLKTNDDLLQTQAETLINTNR